MNRVLPVLFLYIFTSLFSVSLSAENFSLEIAAERECLAKEFVEKYSGENSADHRTPNIEIDGSKYQKVDDDRDDWTAFVSMAETFFGEDLLYNVLYNDNVRNVNGKIHVTSTDLEWRYSDSFFRDGIRNDADKLVSFNDDTYIRYTPYSMDEWLFTKIYSVDLWEYNEASQSWIMLNTNSNYFPRSRNYPSYEGERNAISEIFDAYAEAVRLISQSINIFNLYNNPLKIYTSQISEADIDNGYVYQYIDSIYSLQDALSMTFSKELVDEYLSNDNIIPCDESSSYISLKVISPEKQYDLADKNTSIDIIAYDSSMIKVKLSLPEYDKNGQLETVNDFLVIIENGKIVYEEYSGLYCVNNPATKDNVYDNYFICFCIITSCCFLCMKRKEQFE